MLATASPSLHFWKTRDFPTQTCIHWSRAAGRRRLNALGNACLCNLIRERTLDQSELDTYAKMAGPSLEGLPIKFLAAYGYMTLPLLEGRWNIED